MVAAAIARSRRARACGSRRLLAPGRRAAQSREGVSFDVVVLGQALGGEPLALAVPLLADAVPGLDEPVASDVVVLSRSAGCEPLALAVPLLADAVAGLDEPVAFDVVVLSRSAGCEPLALGRPVHGEAIRIALLRGHLGLPSMCWCRCLLPGGASTSGKGTPHHRVAGT